VAGAHSAFRLVRLKVAASQFVQMGQVTAALTELLLLLLIKTIAIDSMMNFGKGCAIFFLELFFLKYFEIFYYLFATKFNF
jgi:hypothetical protein